MNYVVLSIDLMQLNQTKKQRHLHPSQTQRSTALLSWLAFVETSKGLSQQILVEMGWTGSFLNHGDSMIQCIGFYLPVGGHLNSKGVT